MDTDSVHPGAEHGAGDDQTLWIVTPSYAKDFQLCRDLCSSVRRWAGPGIYHHVIVPTADLPLFYTLSDEKTIVHDVREFITSHFIKMPGINAWINLSRPWPPVRGWVTQQLVKLAVAEACTASAVLIADSDMVFVSPFAVGDLLSDGEPALYRQPGAVHSGLPVHRKWHETACRLLALDPPGRGDLTDYVCWPCLWDPALVRALLRRVAKLSGRPWQTVIGAQVFFSEMMLYGIFAESKGNIQMTDRMLAVAYSDEVPLEREALHHLLQTVPEGAIAVMISAKSGTDLELRNREIEEFITTRSFVQGDQS